MATSSNKRIAKNTLLLYFRMLLTIAVGLYTSRVVLNTLGVSDYGIYNVVGGIVSMLAFLNSAMVAASQRFISFELGTNDSERLKKVFCTSVSIHIVLALIIFLIAETLGLWFVNTHLNIPAERMGAANWVYQCSILTLMLTVVSVPYNSCIVAHEHMKAFAYVSILEAVLKLLVVYLLLVGAVDKLVLYAILVAAVAFVIRIIYGIYCKRYFEECTYRFVLDRKLFKEMFAFAGWSVIGNLGFSMKDQGSNIILNLFFDTAVNGRTRNCHASQWHYQQFFQQLHHGLESPNHQAICGRWHQGLDGVGLPGMQVLFFLTTYDSNPCFHQHGLPVAIMAENGSSIYTPIPDACIDCCFGECHGISCCDCVAGYREHKSISDCHLCHHVMRTAVGVSHFSLRRKPLPGNVPGCTGQFYRSVCTIPDTKKTYTDIQIEIFHLFHCPEKSVHSGCLPCDSLLHKIHV